MLALPAISSQAGYDCVALDQCLHNLNGKGPFNEDCISLPPHSSGAKQSALPAQELCDQGLWRQTVSLLTIQLNCWADPVVPWRFSLSQRWNKLGTVHLKCLLQQLLPELSYCDCVYPKNKGERS